MAHKLQILHSFTLKGEPVATGRKRVEDFFFSDSAMAKPNGKKKTPVIPVEIPVSWIVDVVGGIVERKFSEDREFITKVAHGMDAGRLKGKYNRPDVVKITTEREGNSSNVRTDIESLVWFGHECYTRGQMALYEAIDEAERSGEIRTTADIAPIVTRANNMDRSKKEYLYLFPKATELYEKHRTGKRRYTLKDALLDANRELRIFDQNQFESDVLLKAESAYKSRALRERKNGKIPPRK